MPKYSFQAFTETGSSVNGVIEADSPDAATNMIAARGQIPVSVTAIRGSSGSGLAGLIERLTPVRAEELVLFTKQFRTMLKAGVSMVKILQILEDQAENEKLKNIIGAMSKDIQEGASLQDAFSKHPKAFSPLYCGMVQAGEASGALPDVLERLTYIIEHERKIRSDIKAALQYPIIVLILLVGAFFTLLTLVVPKFVNIFTKTGVEIPIPTKITMLMYQGLTQYWLILLPLAVLVVVTGGFYFSTEKGKLFRDGALLRVPVVGPLFVKSAMSRFASIFSIMQSSGVSVREGMKILTDTIGNRAIAAEFGLINERLEEGRGISEPLRSSKYFTPIVINMVAIGEESGNLDEMLREISEHYDVEVEYAMKKLSDALGPVLTVGLAVVVGFFALAIFLPMWDLTKMVKL